jgi:hypothetical protein
MAALPILGDGTNNLLRKITENTYQGSLSVQGFQVPSFDEIELSYYGSTNNIAQVIYKKSGDNVKVLTLTYVNGGVADNDRIATIG